MSIRDISYYNWENVYSLGNSLTPVTFTGSVLDFVTTASFATVALDPVSGGIYMGGTVYYSGSLGAGSSPNPFWHVVRSLDNGDSWQVVDQFVSGGCSAIGIYRDGTIISTGTETSGTGGGATPVWTTRKSHVTASDQWITVNRVALSASNTASSGPTSIAFGLSGAIYVGGAYQKSAGGAAGWLVRRSNVSNPNSWVTILDSGSNFTPHSVLDMAVRANDMVTAGGQELWLIGTRGSNAGIPAITVMTSSDDINFTRIYSASTFDEPSIGKNIVVNPVTRDVYIATLISNPNTYDLLRVFSASFATNPRPSQANQFGQVWQRSTARWRENAKFTMAYSGTFYYTLSHDLQTTANPGNSFWYTVRSKNAIFSSSGDLEIIDSLRGNQFPRNNLTSSEGGAIAVRKENNDEVIYQTTHGGTVSTGNTMYRHTGVIRRGQRTANSATLGPTMLATSMGYVKTEISGVQEGAYVLNNVSEFGHAGGIFQIRSLVLGTRESGKIGKTDDSIIRVSHIGSVVKVMWPKQDSIDAPIKGFGDFSAGERAGKLSTAFSPGESVDVTEFDHLTLFGYLSKETSGTLDDVIIVIERKPLKDNAFAIEQSIDYAISGSKTEARLRDIEYKKQIDYGDLSINKIGFPIDVPLVNTKTIRISARHRLGQSELNKNFIVWGRFIKSSKETNET